MAMAREFRRTWRRWLGGAALVSLAWSGIGEAAAGSALPAESPSGPPPAAAALRLHYDRPAAKWTEALPIGNGRLGAMVFGGTAEERLQLNEDTLWSGRPHDDTNPEAAANLAKARELILAGKSADAQKLIDAHLMGRPRFLQAYQPLGDLRIELPGHERATDYRRELDLRAGIARVSYRAGGVRYTREAFSSAADQCIALHFACERPGGLELTATLASPHRSRTKSEGEARLALEGQWIGTGKGASLIAGVKGPGLRFRAELLARADGGRIEAREGKLHVRGASSVTLLVVAATSFESYRSIEGDPAERCRRYREPLSRKSYREIRAAHLADFRPRMERVELVLRAPPPKERAAQETTPPELLPTDERLRAAAAGGADPGLAALYFQFGRYLLLSASRPGTQPANLQGIWNESQRPPWGSKYTVNINTEMNYWPAEPLNLAECHEPLFDLLEDLTETGGKIAREHYGCRGWVLHHNTDLWRGAAPVDFAFYGMWPSGGAWLAHHLWQHYLYGGDRKFLAERAYPILKGAARFFLDYLVPLPGSDRLVTCPSNSPEHAHHRGVSVCAGPTMDTAIVGSLFEKCREASRVLGVDEELRARLAAARDRLPPFRIGKHGELQEWLEDVEDPEVHHRHLSHLWGLYPGDVITPEKTPELARACRVSLERRGDGGTGWSLAWKISLWARLGEGDHARLVLGNLMRPGHTLPNLFDSCPPFQIDGNFGGAAGIGEMLLQARGGEILLLPALPSAWPEGRVRGLRAPGGFEVGIEWNEGALRAASIRSSWGRRARIRYRDYATELELEPGHAARLDGELAGVAAR